MKKLNKVLLDTWLSAKGPDERDQLRALHEKTNLRALARELNRITVTNGIAVEMSSLWVDWQPQSWKWIAHTATYDKPSVEIADLIVVIWDDNQCQSGTAIVLAGKMGLSHTEFSLSGPSTKKEITFLESPYRFMLSNNMSGVPKPLPGLAQAECEFDFRKSGLDSWRWLLIRKRTCSKWRYKTIRHTVKDKAVASHSDSLAKLLSDAVINRPTLGSGEFVAGCNCSQWCRLINLLLGHTASVAMHPKAKGPARVDTFMTRVNPAVTPHQQHNCSFVSLGLPSCIPPDLMLNADGTTAVLSNDGDGEKNGRFDAFDDSAYPLCPILFVTKHPVPDYVRTRS